MSNKLRAFRKTTGFFAIALIIATLFVYATLWIPLEYIVYALISGMFTYVFWIIYQVNLEQMDREDERNKR